MKKIIIYYSHRQTLGHQSRIANITASLRLHYSKKARVFLFNAGLPEECLHFPRGTVCVNLPTPFHSKHDFRIDRKNFVRGDIAGRSKFMLEQVERIRPDVFVTEFFPFGRPDLIDEIFPVLRVLRTSGVKILSSLGYPYVNPFFFTPDKLRTFVLLGKYYENVLIHTPSRFEDGFAESSLDLAETEFQRHDLKKPFLDVMSAVKDKIIYTGYVASGKMKNARRPACFGNSEYKGKTFVLVSRGGGVIYPKLLASAVLAKKILGDGYVFLIVPGPASTDAEMALFSALVKQAGGRGIMMQKYIPDLFRHVRYCDVSVSMCGYNTSVELMYFRKKSIVVPWQLWENKNNSFFNDQIFRSLMLKKYLGSRVIPYNAISAELIAEGIKEQLTKDRPGAVLREADFEGADITAKRIMAS
ncbi:MAG: hypothetical protein HQL22_08970 [Candidatus Omnitrophica bacterium]|nr:hypothetical protein [Candidatus Omnitrophota bacterium]